MNSSNIMEFLKKYDYTFFGITTSIFVMGIVNLYSATYGSHMVWPI